MSMMVSKIECRWSLLIWLACLVMIVCLANCAGSPPRASIATCQGLDWYEIGRRDGATGADASLLADYQKQCRKDKNHPDAELYINGRNAGLVDYCTPQVGLETARYGHSYAGVCPTHLEKTFLEGFQAGLKVRTLEAEDTVITAQIASLSRTVAAVDEPVVNQAEPNGVPETLPDTRAKLAKLRERHEANEAAINALEQQTKK